MHLNNAYHKYAQALVAHGKDKVQSPFLAMALRAVHNHQNVTQVEAR